MQRRAPICQESLVWVITLVEEILNSLHAVITYARMRTYTELNRTCVRVSNCVVAQLRFQGSWAVEDLFEAKTNRVSLVKT